MNAKPSEVPPAPYSPSTFLHYASAVLGVVLATVARWLLDPLFKDGQQFALFYLAATIVALFGGFGPGLLATLLGAVSVSFFFLAPRYSLSIGTSRNAMAMVLYVTNLLVVSLLAEARARSRTREREGRDQLLSEMTERVEALQAVKRIEEQFRALADSMPQIVWTSKPNGAFDYYNKKWFDFTGLTAAQSSTLEGWKQVIHPDDFLPAMELWNGSLKSGEPFEVEYRFNDRQRDGYRWHLGRALATRDDAGAIERWYGSCTDIDDQKLAEKAAEAANVAKDRFLAVLSHELRTPLTPVLLAVSSLIETQEADGRVLPTLEMVRRNVTLEARLIDDLLDLTRIIQGKMTYHPEPADAHALIQYALDICKADVESGAIDVALELAATDHHVVSDPARLQQVFWNLIKNAVKFSGKGGKLTIRTRNKPAADGLAHLIVEFQDSGIGIAPEFLPRVFDPFEQGEASFRTRRYGGLGLGLAISRSVVEAHGGTLSAQSEGTNQGATFRLEIATTSLRIQPVVIPKSISSLANAAGENLHILLVEDDPSTRHILTRVLKKLGHEVTTADSVSSAVLAAEGQNRRVHLILSDIGLPDGSGLDVVRLLRPMLSAPAIALTGFGTEEDIRKGKEAGFAAHLVKPIEADVLQATIRRVAASVA